MGQGFSFENGERDGGQRKDNGEKKADEEGAENELTEEKEEGGQHHGEREAFAEAAFGE